MDKDKYFDIKGIKGNYQSAIASETAKALRLFCEQEQEFEQAIEDSGKSFSDCLNSIVKGIKRSISDLDVFKRAVNFYFPGATVHFQMCIDLVGDAAEKQHDPPITMTQNKPSSLGLSLDDLLGDI